MFGGWDKSQICQHIVRFFIEGLSQVLDLQLFQVFEFGPRRFNDMSQCLFSCLILLFHSLKLFLMTKITYFASAFLFIINLLCTFDPSCDGLFHIVHLVPDKMLQADCHCICYKLDAGSEWEFTTLFCMTWFSCATVHQVINLFIQKLSQCCFYFNSKTVQTKWGQLQEKLIVMYTLLLDTTQHYEMHYTCAVSVLGCFFHKHVNMECAGLHRDIQDCFRHAYAEVWGWICLLSHLHVCFLCNSQSWCFPKPCLWWCISMSIIT